MLFGNMSWNIPDIVVRCHSEVHLNTFKGKCIVDGVKLWADVGNWMFYIPGSGEKFFHAYNENLDCIHPSRPSSFDHELSGQTYTLEEWQEALETPLEVRLAEILVSSLRLWQSGLGPRPLGITFARQMYRDSSPCGPTMGLISQNVNKLRRKEECSDADVISAGVKPDKIRSCIRQQVRGYVIDLCSVVGVKPVDATEEVKEIIKWIRSTDNICNLVLRN